MGTSAPRERHVGQQADSSREHDIQSACDYTSTANLCELCFGHLICIRGKLPSYEAAAAKYEPLRRRALNRVAPYLTAREREVLWFILNGLRQADIAREMDLDQHTVNTYVSRIYQKLGIPEETNTTHALTSYVYEISAYSVSDDELEATLGPRIEDDFMVEREYDK